MRHSQFDPGTWDSSSWFRRVLLAPLPNLMRLALVVEASPGLAVNMRN